MPDCGLPLLCVLIKIRMVVFEELIYFPNHHLVMWDAHKSFANDGNVRFDWWLKGLRWPRSCLRDGNRGREVAQGSWDVLGWVDDRKGVGRGLLEVLFAWVKGREFPYQFIHNVRHVWVVHQVLRRDLEKKNQKIRLNQTSKYFKSHDFGVYVII